MPLMLYHALLVVQSLLLLEMSQNITPVTEATSAVGQSMPRH